MDFRRVQRSRWSVPLAFAVLGAWGWACQQVPSGSGSASDETTSGPGPTTADETGPLPEDVDRRDVLRSIADNVVIPATVEFADLAAQLRTATEALANTGGGATELDAAQSAWTSAATQWQLLELMQIGPAAPAVTGIAGEGIRDEVYSWPTIDTCGVDRAIVDQAYEQNDFIASEFVDVYGLDALEYLLFVHDQQHSCPPQVQLDGPWAALTLEEIESRRAAYADAIAQEVVNQAGVLAKRWSPAEDDFGSLLANPGDGDSPYDGDLQALNDVFRAMFYIDLRTKDDKLGRALGLVDGSCTSVPCADLLEARFGGMSKIAIAQNLRALRDMVRGGTSSEHPGFDDLLNEMGQGDIAARLLGDIDAAIADADAIEGQLQQALVNDIESVEALHASIKQVTDTLKGPFVMALMLTVPMEGAGDND